MIAVIVVCWAVLLVTVVVGSYHWTSVLRRRTRPAKSAMTAPAGDQAKLVSLEDHRHRAA